MKCRTSARGVAWHLVRERYEIFKGNPDKIAIQGFYTSMDAEKWVESEYEKLAKSPRKFYPKIPPKPKKFPKFARFSSKISILRPKILVLAQNDTETNL